MRMGDFSIVLKILHFIGVWSLTYPIEKTLILTFWQKVTFLNAQKSQIFHQC